MPLVAASRRLDDEPLTRSTFLLTPSRRSESLPERKEVVLPVVLHYSDSDVEDGVLLLIQTSDEEEEKAIIWKHTYDIFENWNQLIQSLQIFPRLNSPTFSAGTDPLSWLKLSHPTLFHFLPPRRRSVMSQRLVPSALFDKVSTTIILFNIRRFSQSFDKNFCYVERAKVGSDRQKTPAVNTGILRPSTL